MRKGYLVSCINDKEQSFIDLLSLQNTLVIHHLNLTSLETVLTLFLPPAIKIQ